MIELIIGFIISFFEKIVVKRLLYPGILLSFLDLFPKMKVRLVSTQQGKSLT